MATEISKLGPGLLTFGETGSAKEFGVIVSEAAIEPEYDSDDAVPVLSGDEFGGDEVEKWTLKFTMFQQYTANSLMMYLINNRGEEVPFTFVPDKEGALQAKGKVRLRAPKIGGEVKKRNTSELELPVIGDPTIDDKYTAAG